jgi:hypothetical protein
MGIAYTSVTTAEAYNTTTVTTGSISVQAGDLICVSGHTTTSLKTFDSISNSNDDIDWSMLTDQTYVTIGWGIAVTTESITVTGNFSASASWGRIIVYVFRPDSGETVDLSSELSGNTAAGGDTTSIATGEYTFTDTDVLVFAAAGSSSSSSDVISPKIPIGTDADGNQIIASGQQIAFYKTFTSGTSGVEAQVTRDGGYSTVSIVGAVFKSTSGGSTASIPAIMHHFAMMRR